MRLALIVMLTLALCACSGPKEYELKGQVLSIDVARREATIKHEDIRGFMPAMTMPFKVKEEKLLEVLSAGDLVTATLVVAHDQAYLSAITRTGHAPLPATEGTLAAARTLDPGQPVPDVALIDERGRARQLSDWKGKTVALTFVYTRCPLPDFCPRMDRHFAAVQRDAMADPELRERVRLLSVSFDPEYDTPAVLKAHASRVGADPAMWTYATGRPEAIAGFAREFGMSIVRQDPQTIEIVHNLRTAVIGADGTLVTILNGNDWAPADLLGALKDASARR